MYIKKLLFSYLIFLLTLHANEPNQKVTLHLDWLNQFQFAGYYIAKENHYYSDLGLDVDIIEYPKNTNANLSKKVIEDEAIYAIGKSSLILDRLEGNNIVLLSAIFQNSPMVLISLADSNIKEPRDLINSKIMITSDAKQSAVIRSIFIAEGISTEKISIQNFNKNVDDLINKKVDVIASYLSNEPYFLKQKNIAFNIIRPENYDFDFYEGILFTSQKELENNPIRVQNFNQASLKGWEYAFNNIEETAKLIYEKYNTQNKSLEALIYEGKVLKELSKIDDDLLGNINPKTIDELKRLYSILNLNNTNTFFETNSIIFNKCNTLLTKDELAYLRDNHFTLLTQSYRIPFSFKNLNQPIGIELDLWQLLSLKLEKPFNVEEVIKDGIMSIFSDSVKAKFIYSFNKPSSDKFVFSDSIAHIPIAMATKDKINYISTLNSLENVNIGVLKNLDILDTLKKVYPNVNFIEINTSDEGISKLKNDSIFALIDNLYTLSHKIEKLQIKDLKINTTLKYKLNVYLEVKKEDEQFVKIVNKTINTISLKQINSILNNYQLILYQNNIDFFFILKFIVPLVALLSVFIFLNYRLRNEIIKRKEVEIKLSNLANNDSLTKIYNRRKIEEICENEIQRTQRYSNDLSIIFFDINDFKIINDELGHHKGDELLIKIAEVISQNIRTTDSLGRWGGDEFLIVLPETNFRKTKTIIKSLESQLKNINSDLGIKHEISCSFGLSQYEENDTFDSFIKRADDSMYIEKDKHRSKK